MLVLHLSNKLPPKQQFVDDDDDDVSYFKFINPAHIYIYSWELRVANDLSPHMVQIASYRYLKLQIAFKITNHTGLKLGICKNTD